MGNFCHRRARNRVESRNDLNDQTFVSIDELRVEIMKDLATFRLLLDEPRLYVDDYFDEIRKYINDQANALLNECNEDAARIEAIRAVMLNKLREHQSQCQIKADDLERGDGSKSVHKMHSKLDKYN